jgi:DNA-directed RNA polymerase subunit omega
LCLDSTEVAHVNPISIDDLARRFGSRFDLVVAAAKRAGQIKDGAPPLVETTSRNPLTIALEEIAAGKVLLKDATEEMLREPEPVVQDYLVRRGSLQDQIATYALVDEEEDEEYDEEEEEELEEEEEIEGELESPFGEEYDEEEAEFEFGFGEEPDQTYPEELEEEAEDLEESYLGGEGGEEEEEEEGEDEEEEAEEEDEEE